MESPSDDRGKPYHVLRERNLALFVCAHVLAITSLWGSRITIDWMVLELTHSAVQVGIVAAMQFAPMLLAGFYGGVISDVLSQRLILIATNLAQAGMLIATGVMALLGSADLVALYALSLTIGLLTILDNPARQVIVGSLVPRHQLREAVQLNSGAYQVGALAGPALIGLMLTQWGGGVALLCAAGISLLAVVLISLVKQVRSSTQGRAVGGLVTSRRYVFGGFRYMFRHPEIFLAIALAFVMSILARNVPVLLTDYASNIFSSGSSGFAIMNAIVAGGAVIGVAILTASRGSSVWVVIRLLMLVGLANLIASLAGASVFFFIALGIMGAAQFAFGTAANAFVQVGTNHRLRGRVLAIMTSLFLGGQAVGGPIIGALIEHFGGQTTLAITGGLVLAIGLAAGGFWRFRRHRRATIRN